MKYICTLALLALLLMGAYTVHAASVINLTVGVVSADADTVGALVVVERCTQGGSATCQAFVTIAISNTQGFAGAQPNESRLVLAVEKDRRYRVSVHKAGMYCYTVANPCPVEDYVADWATAVLFPFELKRLNTRQYLPLLMSGLPEPKARYYLPIVVR